MELKKFITYVNKFNTEELALVDITNKDIKVIMSGDYYHNKTEHRIDGFFIGLDYLGIKYEVNAKEITPEHELFYTFGFNDDED